MSRSRFARLATVTSAAMLATLLLGVGGAVARTPGWTITVETAQPGTVGPGSVAAWKVTLANIGKSNISAVFLGTDIPLSSGLATPVYISDAVWSNQSGPSRPCGSAPYSGPLNCSFGNIIASDPDASVTLTIAFTAGSSGTSYGFNFKTTGNGNTLSDGGTSHGDTLFGPASVALNPSPEFAGGYSLPGGDTFTTGTSLTKNNPQSSSVTGPNLLGVTVTEGGGSPDATDPCKAYTCIGQWDRVTVGTGHEGPVKLELTILGSTVKGSIGVNDINLYHTGDGVITARCPSSTPSTGQMPCIIVTQAGANFHIVAWLLNNGGARGLF